MKFLKALFGIRSSERLIGFNEGLNAGFELGLREALETAQKANNRLMIQIEKDEITAKDVLVGTNGNSFLHHRSKKFYVTFQIDNEWMPFARGIDK